MSFLARASTTNLFPIYLLPSIPFRRRRSLSTDSTSSTSTTVSDSPTTPDAVAPPYLTGHTSHLRCARCATDLCLTSQIISKGFTGRHGRAYLVSPTPAFPAPIPPHQRSLHNPHLPNLPNTFIHKPVPRQLVTGAHTVSDVSCVFCGSVIGWKYESAEEEGQRYKVGKFILETKKIFESCDWERGEQSNVVRGNCDEAGIEEVEFDSQDEDECEDLFAGVWSSALAVRRRQGKRFGRRGQGL